MKIRIKSADITVRNPVAASLSSLQYCKRVIRDKTKYSRKNKHRKGDF